MTVAFFHLILNRELIAFCLFHEFKEINVSDLSWTEVFMKQDCPSDALRLLVRYLRHTGYIAHLQI